MKEASAKEPRRGERSLVVTFWLPMMASLFDVLAVTGAALLSYYLRFHWPLMQALPPHWKITDTYYYLTFGLVLGVVYVAISWSYRGYNVRVRQPLDQEVGRILRGSVLALGLVLAAIFFYREFSYSRLVFLLTLLFMVPALIVSRSLFQRVQIALFRRGVGVQRVALWGTGEVAAKLWRDFERGRTQGFELVGAVGKPPVENVQPLGEVEQLRDLVFAHDLDLLVMAPPPEEEDRMNEVMKAAEGLTVELLYCPSAVEITRSRIRVTEVGGRPILRLKTVPMAGWRYVVKRTLDFAFSALFLLAFSWLYGLIALAVRLDSGRPIFYKQRRVGMDGREFDVIKFRTMRTDAEAKTGPVWAKGGDPRATRVGRFLRRWSLDELPQFWSVLRGEMSLVGPRPERPHFVEEFSRHIPQYLDRHRVKSGLTGWAQVCGLRGSDSTIEERTEYDLFYVENWSLWFDVRILLRTVVEVIRGRGAM
ncbi:MAG: undecaprenyl-phosphate glucose phosphotransferase [bacterium]|nr:undecaprenyl-phosphate glucose phosphotransferase [bacterium]